MKSIYHFKIKDIPVSIHWSILVVLLNIFLHYTHPLHMIIAICLHLGLITLHLLGHIFFLQLFQISAKSIQLNLWGGNCDYNLSVYARENFYINSGGIIFQLLILIPVLFLLLLLQLATISLSALMKMIFVTSLLQTNLFIMLINLLPFAGFDGSSIYQSYQSLKTNSEKIDFRQLITMILSKKPDTHKNKEEGISVDDDIVKKTAHDVMDELMHQARDTYQKKNKPKD
ncbi:MAG: hypothetical protein MJB14_21890 [Spirochaetes bacterium]|nr:hypothetical protein [Spirochaetota bacterium]